MESLSFYIGITGNIISVLLFLSPAKTFWRIAKNGSTEEFESFPYVCTLLSSTMWTYYGVTRPGSYLVATVNGFGVLVEIIYLSFFFIYAPPTMKAKTMTLVGILDVGFPSAAFLVTLFALHGDTRIDAIGFICAGLNIIMYASPLAAMKTVVTTKSVEYMPFLLSFFVMLNGGIWAVYAILEQDWFLEVPNAAGFILGMAQLVLYAVYCRPKSIKSSNASSDHDRVENALQHEHLLSSIA